MIKVESLTRNCQNLHHDGSIEVEKRERKKETTRPNFSFVPLFSQVSLTEWQVKKKKSRVRRLWHARCVSKRR